MTVKRTFVKTVMEPADPPAPADTAPRQTVNTSSIVLSDSILLGIAARPDLRAEFPFMHPVTQSAGKLCCGAAKTAQQAFQKQLDAMKSALNTMNAAQKARFKELLQVGKVVVYLGGGRFDF